MKYVIFTFLFLLISCGQKDLEVTLPDQEIFSHDSLEVKIQNNTNKDYLFFFEHNRLEYSESSNSLEVIITKNKKPVKSQLAIIDAFVIPDEDGYIDKKDSLEAAKFFDCSEHLIKVVPAKSHIMLKFLILDEANRCGAGFFPEIKKNQFYELKLKINTDTTLIKKEEMKQINTHRKGKKIKLFQGQLESNTVKLNN
ncbi:hypothetical protein [Riemerella columbina]|uniref:hypothetical protein n=1 Tax=Riemerella columbina TaxID=103810 RepID=UPI00266FF714|nr:hypothetical protein [Riemerella columbina]WKS95310.1 hypothetical protein NYR17_00800 [Riemerella columbina]